MVTVVGKRGRRRADPPPRRSHPTGARGTGKWVWGTLLVVAALAVLLLARVDVLPLAAQRSAAVVLTTMYGAALAVRTGGRPIISAALCLVLGAVGVVLAEPILLAGLVVLTGAVAAVLGVMLTVPAATFSRVVREVLVAVVVAAGGAFAIEGYAAEVSRERLAYVVLALSLAGALLLVFRLGAGLHGLGRRGSVILAAGLGAVVVTLAYTEALRRWASPALLEAFESFVAQVDSTLGGVPQPLAILLGFPALAWGVSMRARRRQGWWVCAFGVAATGPLAVALASVGLVTASLSLLYSLLAGLVVGYGFIRLDQFLTGPRGRRARQLEAASAHRPEPRRTAPVL